MVWRYSNYVSVKRASNQKQKTFNVVKHMCLCVYVHMHARKCLEGSISKILAVLLLLVRLLPFYCLSMLFLLFFHQKHILFYN